MANNLNTSWSYPFPRPHSWDWLDERWYAQYLELKKFKETYGHCRVPYRWKENVFLGGWVSTQRSVKTKMVSWRKELLDAIGFTWRISPKLQLPRKSWEERFQELIDFKASHGHCNVPQGWQENPQLAGWIRQQRTQFKKEKLSFDKIEKLNELGFMWKLGPSPIPWAKRYQTLVNYQKQHGHCRVSPNDDKKLASWIQYQRSLGTTMSQERQELLNLLGFEWRLKSKHLSWDEQYQQLVIFWEKHGHCRVPDHDLPLGSWVRHLRENYRKKKLDSNKIKKLEALGFVWNIPEMLWNQRYQELKVYQETYGHCRPPVKEKATQTLANWVIRQRRNQAKLDASQRAKLDILGFEWKVQPGIGPSKTIKWQRKSKYLWQQKYQQLKEFHATYGHCTPSRGEKFNSLANWVNRQRVRYRNKKLSAEQISLLENLNFEWSKIGKDVNLIKNEKQWLAMFTQLNDFRKIQSHCNVPPKQKPFKPLGKWVITQRYLRKKGKLSQKRIDLLDSIGFEWSRINKRKTTHSTTSL